MKSLARAFFRVVFTPFVVAAYRVRRIGRENVPATGGVLLLSNHVSYIDAFVVYLASPRPVRFVVLESYANVKAIGWFLRLFGAIPIRPEKAKEAIVRTVAALEAGDVVCLFPEGGLTRLGVTMEFKKGFELIARKANCPVVPVYLDGLFGSIFSFERDRYFRKRPLGLTCPLRVAFGPAIPPGEATAERVRLAVWEQSTVAFAQRREFRRPLEVATVRSLKRRCRSLLFAELGRGGPRRWTRGGALALATAIARRWMARSGEAGERVGLLLPPGPTTSILHLGLVLAGRTPVNLPFTVDQREVEAIARSVAPLGIRTVITSRAFMPHLMDFWHGDEGAFIDFKSVVSSPGPLMALLERLRALLEPAWLTCWRLDLHRRDPDREAVGLIPHPGEAPIFLSGRELLRDTRRVYSANFVRGDDIVFTEDCLARPEGLVFGCWGPILGRGRAVGRSLSQRDDDGILGRLLRDHGATLMAGSAEFFRATAGPLATPSLKWGVVFGPADPGQLEEDEARLGLPLARAWSWEGRVVAMSRADPDPDLSGEAQPQPGCDAKSVGYPLPGIAAKVEGGRLWLKPAPEDPWRPGPKGAAISPVGLLHLRDEAAGIV